MATALAEEIRQVQNPALGAVLLWRFVVGYSAERGRAEGATYPLLFLPLPLLLHEETFRHLASTQERSGLRAFTTKFGTERTSQTDVLLGLHDRVRGMRALSRDALWTASKCSLLVIDVKQAAVFPLSRTLPKSRIPEEIKPLAKNAEKLGAWCARITLSEIAAILKVRF